MTLATDRTRVANWALRCSSVNERNSAALMKVRHDGGAVLNASDYQDGIIAAPVPLYVRHDSDAQQKRSKIEAGLADSRLAR